MQCNSNLCCKCYALAKAEQYSCAVCKESKRHSSFDADVLHHHRYRSSILVCKDCQAKDYSPLPQIGQKTYTCQFGCKRGHKAFDSQHLWHKNYDQKRRLTCKYCDAKPKYQCEGPDCKRSKRQKLAESFPNHAVPGFSKTRVTKVCTECRDKGYSDKSGGLEAYECEECRGKMGHAKFNAQDLKDKRRRPSMKLRCQSCKDGR